MRDLQKFRKHQFALLHTMHPTLYRATELLDEQSYFESMPESFLQDMNHTLQVKIETDESLSIVRYWLALIHMKRKDYISASYYAFTIDKVNFENPVQTLKWQPLFLAIQMHCQFALNGKFHEHSEQLLRTFGSQQSMDEKLQRFYPEISRLLSDKWPNCLL